MTTPAADEKTSWAHWLVCALVVSLCLFGLGASLVVPAANLTDQLNQVGTGLMWLMFGGVGALIVLRRPRNAIGWLMLVPALSGGLEIPLQLAVGGLLAGRASPAAPAPPLALALGWFSGWSWWLLIGPVLLLILLFPTGRLLSPRWRWVVVLLGVVFLYFLSIATLAKVGTVNDSDITMPNPIGILSDGQIQALLPPMFVGLSLCTLLCVAGMLLRYRRAGAVERAQMRWLLYASALFLVVYPLSLFSSGADWSGLLFGVCLLALPVAIGVAVLRYRLWDIDVIIRRTLVYSLLTGVLALAYFGSVVLLQNVLRALTSQGQNPIATVISTLMIAALFVPLRGRVQAFIDRRFYRQKYDAAQTLAEYGAHLRDETDLDQVNAHLISVVEHTMQPQSVSLWLPGRDVATRGSEGTAGEQG